MSLDTGRYRLYSSFKTLAAHWEETRLHWIDGVAQEFEENQWDALEPRVKAALTGIDRLAQIMVRARQECG